MMRHDPKWATFNSAYINENVQFDIQNAFIDEPSEDSLIGLFTHVSLSRDPRAQRNMVPDEVREALPPDPKITALEREREALKNGRYRYQGQVNEQKIRDLTTRIRAKRSQRDKELQESYRSFYFYNRPTWDIESESGDEEELIQPEIKLQIPERSCLAELLCNQPETTTFEEMQELRSHACNLMVDLCHRRETAKRVELQQRAKRQPTSQQARPEKEFPLLMLATQCPRCIGDARLSYEERVFEYGRPATRNRHFNNRHLEELQRLGQDNLIFCEHPQCVKDGVKLLDVNHFRNHVETIHGVRLQPHI